MFRFSRRLPPCVGDSQGVRAQEARDGSSGEVWSGSAWRSGVPLGARAYALIENPRVECLLTSDNHLCIVNNVKSTLIPDLPRVEKQTLGASYRTLREIAQDALLRDLVEGRLPPGHRLVESELVQMYGISRGPIREALRGLEGQGLVRSLSNRGFVVTRLSRRQISEIYNIRVALEALAARDAAEKMTEAKVVELEALLRGMSAAVDRPEEWLTINNRFHLSLYAASDEQRLVSLIEDQMSVVEPYIRRFLHLPTRLLDTHADHRTILDAAVSHDGEECQRLVTEHLRRAGQIIVSLVPEDDGPREGEEDG